MDAWFYKKQSSSQQNSSREVFRHRANFHILEHLRVRRVVPGVKCLSYQLRYDTSARCSAREGGIECARVIAFALQRNPPPIDKQAVATDALGMPSRASRSRRPNWSALVHSRQADELTGSVNVKQLRPTAAHESLFQHLRIFAWLPRIFPDTRG